MASGYTPPEAERIERRRQGQVLVQIGLGAAVLGVAIGVLGLVLRVIGFSGLAGGLSLLAGLGVAGGVIAAVVGYGLVRSTRTGGGQ